jgi:hypothetical protein
VSPFYVEFAIADEQRFDRLAKVFDALKAAKESDAWADESYWRRFFDTDQLAQFWSPTQAEADEHLRRWLAAPLETRSTDPSLRKPWTFMSMIGAFENGDYSLIACVRGGSQLRGRIEFEPHGHPYGGTGAVRKLIETFGHQVLEVKD